MSFPFTYVARTSLFRNDTKAVVSGQRLISIHLILTQSQSDLLWPSFVASEFRSIRIYIFLNKKVHNLLENIYTDQPCVLFTPCN